MLDRPKFPSHLDSVAMAPSPARWGATALLFAVVFAVPGGLLADEPLADEPRPPNIVIILTDDQGYADLGVFGAEGFKTPRVDRLAEEGLQMTDFLVAASVCTASRAALMTGCYPVRVSMFGALNHTSREGLHPDELLLSELCKQQGYATACFGKWHLGTVVEFFPTRRGFDEFFGIPYSNDNSKYHPVAADMPPLPLYDGERVIAHDPDQSQFTKQITQRSVAFIKKHKDQPFLLYVPHIMPHVPIFASEEFAGKSEAGLYGDVIEELDWSVGQIVDCLEEHGLTDNTWIIFFSDNGPFLSYGEHAGNAGDLREGKLTTFEGGFRSPCVMRWPAKIPAGSVSGEMASAMDLLPTVAEILDVELPADRTLDGRSILDLVTDPENATSPHETFFFYAGRDLQAVRNARYKLHFPHPYLTVAAEPGREGFPSNHGQLDPMSITSSGLEGIASRHGYRVAQAPQALYDLREDPGETTDVQADHPDVVARLAQAAAAMRRELGDALTNQMGQGVRPRATIMDRDDPRLLIPREPPAGVLEEYLRPEAWKPSS